MYLFLALLCLTEGLSMASTSSSNFLLVLVWEVWHQKTMRMNRGVESEIEVPTQMAMLSL